MQKGRAPGICPNCEGSYGEVGKPCPEPICQGKGYHFIPENWYRFAKEFAKRTLKPLDPLLGRTLDCDRYLLIGKIGEGGMGVVYLALQRPLDREVALKLISGAPTLAQFEGEQQAIQTSIERFKREAQAISLLDHPNIVKLHDFGIAKLSGDDEIELPFMALEYVKHGQTLRRAFAQMRKERGGAPIPGDIVLSIFSQILNALGAAHKLGIIHRDMKPENVMIAPVEGNPYFVKVLDFGLAKAVGEMAWALGSLTTRSDIFLGTAFYMAPEQAPHSGEVRHVDHRADLYAVAIMLFEVFTKALPFDGETPLAIMMKKDDSKYDPLSLKQAQELPEGLREFLRKGMARRPEARFASASEMLKALEAALIGRATSALDFVAHPRSSFEERPKTPGSSPGEQPSLSGKAVMNP
jgi:serine/threonine-protein kinase